MLKAIRFLKKKQEEDGTWWGRWGVNYIYGSSAVLVGLSAIGEDMSKPYIQKTVKWFKSHQKIDGGWGECCESYDKAQLKCQGWSTLHRQRGPSWRLSQQVKAPARKFTKASSTFSTNSSRTGPGDEEFFTGTGFPKYFMIRYHNYRNCFPLMALGKFNKLVEDKGAGK